MISQTEFTRRMESAIGLALVCDSSLRKVDLVFSPYTLAMIMRRNKVLNDSFRQILGISENQAMYFVR